MKFRNFELKILIFMVLMIINNIFMVLMIINNISQQQYLILKTSMSIIVSLNIILSHSNMVKLVSSKLPLQHPIMHEVTF